MYYDYLMNSAPAVYKQDRAERSNEAWTVRTTDVVYDGKIDTFASLMKNGATTTYLDPNTAGISLPKLLVD